MFYIAIYYKYKIHLESYLELVKQDENFTLEFRLFLASGADDRDFDNFNSMDE